MNIDIVKNKVISLKGEKLKIKINLGRNKYEYLEGEIDKIHSNLFTLKTDKGIKSFSYSDYATKIVMLTKF